VLTKGHIRLDLLLQNFGLCLLSSWWQRWRRFRRWRSRSRHLDLRRWRSDLDDSILTFDDGQVVAERCWRLTARNDDGQVVAERCWRLTARKLGRTWRVGVSFTQRTSRRIDRHRVYRCLIFEVVASAFAQN
jgi:hypothetical protein